MLKKALATVGIGAGLGALLLPGLAFAAVSVTPGVVQPGSSVTIHATCGPGVTGHAEVVGPAKETQTFDVQLTPSSDGARSKFEVPAGISSLGNWQITATCAGGDGGTATFVVSPQGGAASGDGGNSGNGPIMAAGLMLIGGAVGGSLVMRRRAANAAR